MDNDLNELANFLAVDEDQQSSVATLDVSSTFKTKEKEQSEIHNGDTDSSDDEDKKYSENQKYSDSGRAIKKALKTQTTSTFYSDSPSWKSKSTPGTDQNSLIPQNWKSKSTPGTDQNSLIPQKKAADVFSDPFFGIRIVTPLISSQAMKDRMVEKTAVTFNRLERHLTTFDKTTDWVLAGVIVSKFIKTSQKGKQYACWTLSDLRDNLLTVSIFLFGKAYNDLWKTSTHIVVAILNPTPLENRKSSNDIAALSVINTDQVMIWGQSKDLGTCKARKKNGEPCTSFVNRNQCEFCIYHVKREYGKFTRRSELQSPNGGSLNQLRNKVIGKNEVFYAGKSFTAIPAKPSQKQVKKDKVTLSQLFNKCESRFGPEPLPMVKKATQSSRVLLMKDAERLQKLTGTPATRASLELNACCPEQMTRNNTATSKLSASNNNKKDTQEGSDTNKTKLSSSLVKPEQQFPKTNSEGRLSSLQKPLKNDSPGIIGGMKSATLHKTPTLSKKKQPTKNRFDNLAKPKTDHTPNNIFKQPFSSLSSKGSSYDVCFEFDSETENKKPLEKRVDTPRPIINKKSYCSTLEKQKYTDDVLNNKSVVSEVNKKCKTVNSSSPETSPTVNKASSKPLSERKTSSKYESALNARHLKSNNKTAKLNLEDDEDNTMNESSKPSVNRLKDLVHTNSPKLGVFSSLQLTVSSRASNAKVNALKYVKKNGPINYDESNTKKKKIDSALDIKRKRVDNESNKEESTDNADKKAVLSERFIELMNMKSNHEDLITAAENEEMDNYYEKMEKKEQMEEKMLTTYKVECKAFKCLKCQYKWFSPSDLCKAEKHPIKMISATKRFFQCHNCSNRTVSLEIIPLHPCSNCGQSNWERASMMREKKSSTVTLSIRGGEQTFINSVETGTNLNLLVPE